MEPAVESCHLVAGVLRDPRHGEGRVRRELEGFFELVHPEDQARVRATILAALDNRDVYGCDFRIVRPDGAVRWVTNKGRAFFDGDNQPQRLIGTIIDISYRKETELQLLDADRRKNEFLATLAHELRNPLAPIRNAVQILLLSGLEVPNLQWATDVIDRQVRQMTRLVDDLLEVSRITTGKLEVRKETLDLAAVIREAVETSLPLIEQGGHELTVSVPPEPVIVNADMIRMAQVFSNLLNNAAKYTEPGGHIGISLEAIEDQRRGLGQGLGHRDSRRDAAAHLRDVHAGRSKRASLEGGAGHRTDAGQAIGRDARRQHRSPQCRDRARVASSSFDCRRSCSGARRSRTRPRMN